MFGKKPIDRLDDRLKIIRASLEAAMPNYVHSTSFKRDFQEQDPDELKVGIVMVISLGEQDFDNSNGLIAALGTQRLAIVFHLQGNDADHHEVEQRELTFLEDIKAWAKTGVAGVSVLPQKLEHSGQQYHPYGFATADLNIAPTQTNLS